VALAKSFVVFVHVVLVGLTVVSILCTGDDAFVCGLLHRGALLIIHSSISHLTVQHFLKLLVIVNLGLSLLNLPCQ
jgi:hypothetical protein